MEGSTAVAPCNPQECRQKESKNSSYLAYQMKIFIRGPFPLQPPPPKKKEIIYYILINLDRKERKLCIFCSPSKNILGKGALPGLPACNPKNCINADKMDLKLFIFSLPDAKFSCLLNCNPPQEKLYNPKI